MLLPLQMLANLTPPVASPGAKGGGGGRAAGVGSARLRRAKEIDEAVDRILARMLAPPEAPEDVTPEVVREVAAHPDAPRASLAQIEAALRRVLADIAAEDDEEAAMMLLMQ